ncbi:MAG TPA: hypothetical protein VFS22_07380 [Flavisolibacter sp.]|nr:hypothetical protein [Flavisolibacter sp.]
MIRLVIINIVFLLLILSAFIPGYYFIQYPDDFTFTNYIRHAEWRSLGFVLLALVVASALLSGIALREHKPRRRFLIFLAAFQLFFFLFLACRMLDTYVRNKKEFDGLITEYRKKAESDIRTGFIVIDYAGGLELPGSETEQKMQKEMDSVRKTFGLAYRNSGCIVLPALLKAQKEYIRLTKPFLNKRNGANWEEKMEKGIQAIRNQYR